MVENDWTSLYILSGTAEFASLLLILVDVYAYDDTAVDYCLPELSVSTEQAGTFQDERR